MSFWVGLRYCHDPRLVRFHLQQLRLAERLLMALTGASRRTVRRVMRELWEEDTFLKHLLERYATILGREPRGSDFMFLTGIDSVFPYRVLREQAGSLYFHGLIQYTLVRLLKPTIVVETGGTPGNSSAFMLCALDRNQHGTLHTIDLPPSDSLAEYRGHGGWLHEGMPPEQGSGWAVPDYLRERHRQHLGDARQLLPPLLEELGAIDIFLHDSDHSYAHMAWEFATAWPHLKPGGCLLSDDIDTNTAWTEFVAKHGLVGWRAGGLGAVRKP